MWETRRAPIWIIAAVIAVQFLIAPFFEFVVFPRHWLTPLSNVTMGVVNATLVSNAALFIVVVGGVILLGGGLRPNDVGLAGSKVAAGICFTLVLWLTVNALVAGADFLVGGSVSLNDRWTKRGIPHVLGDLLSQVFGTALYEESVFRGFLTVQALLLFRPLGKSVASIVGIVAVQTLFALIHVPMLLEKGHYWVGLWSTLPQLFAFGAGFAVLYLVTGNLFVAVGTHALVNAVVLIPSDPLQSSHSLKLSDYLYMGFALVAATVWRLTRYPVSARPAPSEH